MTRDDFIAANPLEVELEARGVKLIGAGQKRTGKCPIHKDSSPSLSVDLDKQVWFCHAGCGGGSVIDLIAKLTGQSPVEVLKSAREKESRWERPVAPKAAPIARDPNAPKPTISKIYQYHNQLGAEVFQVVRLIPKSFRQRHVGPDGKWVWNMEGVERFLYRLPHVAKAQQVAICEGEKDAETAVALGYCGTTNVGGGGKWLDGYTESLEGKDVVIFPDNDKAGAEHQKKVFESIAPAAKSVKVVKIPQPFKDLTEYVESFTEQAEAKVCVDRLVDDAQAFFKGTEIPLYSMAELERRYIDYTQNVDAGGLNLGRWLPSLGAHVRTLVPGELVLIVGDTGTGKTGLLQAIALHAAPLPTLMFEIELPAELLFERFVAARAKLRAAEVERTYAGGDYLGQAALRHYFPNLFICDKASLSSDQIEAMIIRSELKLGVRPKVVLIDYVQLIAGRGDRYERASATAEAMKRIAKNTGTIVVIASQRSRPKDGDGAEVTLHSGKDSGSLENSAGLVLGVWRDPEDKTCLHMKVLKNTKGQAGFKLECNFNGEMMTITERARMQYEDPRHKN